MRRMKDWQKCLKNTKYANRHAAAQGLFATAVFSHHTGHSYA